MSFKICSVGCGYMAAAGHGPSLMKYADLHSDTVLAACCDVDEQKAVLFRQKFGFLRHYTDMYAMLRNEKPDVVCLIVPVLLTARLSVDIIEMGFPLILEKPPGINEEETLRIIAAANKNDVVNRVAFNRRYMPMTIEFCRSISTFAGMEKVQNISCDFYRINRCDLDFSATAVHGIDMVRYLAGSDFEHIRFRYREMPEFGTGVADIFMDCTMKSGITAQLSFCPVAGMLTERYTVNAGNHLFQMLAPINGSFDFPGKIVHIKENNIISEISGESISNSLDEFVLGGFYNENASFFDDIKDAVKPPGDVKSTLQSVSAAQYIRYRMDEFRDNSDI